MEMRKTSFLTKFFLWVSLLLFAYPVFAGPAHFTYQGRLFDENGYGLNSGTVSLKLQVTDPTGSCLLREETHSIDMANSQGYFSVTVGFGSPTSNNPSSLAFSSIFDNSSTLSDPNIGCGGGNYTPGSSHHRLLKVAVNGESLSPDQVISSVPFALQSKNSATLGGKSQSDFLQADGSNVTQSNVKDFFDIAATLGNNQSVRWTTGGGGQWQVFTPGTGGSGIGTLTNGRWCRTDGSEVICDVTPVTDTDTTALSSMTGDSDDISQGSTNLYMTSAERTKLTGVAAGAEVNVQADWNEASSSSDAFIANKPAIPSSIGDLTVGNDSISGDAVNGGTISGFASIGIDDNASATAITIDGSENVGVGTTSPGQLLHVDGPMRLTPTALPGGAAAGDIAVDSGDSNKLKYYDGSSWVDVGSGSGGSGSSVAFYAEMSSGSTSTANSTMVFDTVVLNLGSDYNSSTGAFTAEVAGLYQFCFAGNKSAATDTAEMEFRKNGTLIPGASFWSYGHSTFRMYSPLEPCILVEVASGDVITTYDRGAALRFMSDGGSNNSRRTRFSGHLISSSGGGSSSASSILTASTEPSGTTAGQVYFNSSDNKLYVYSGSAWEEVASGTDNVASSNGINVPQLSSHPGSPTVGQIYYNTTTNKLMVYNGTSWVETGSGSGGSGGLGDWASHSVNTNYQAATDGVVVAYNSADGQPYIAGYTDSAATPTTIRTRSQTQMNDNGGAYVSITMPVKKGDYWRVQGSGTGASYTINWIPLSSGGASGTGGVEFLLQDPYVISTQTSVAHSFGGAPKYTVWYLENKTAELGYSTGDRIFYNLDSSGNRGFSTFADSANVGVSTEGSPPMVMHKDSSSKTQITPTNWKIGVIAFETLGGVVAASDEDNDTKIQVEESSDEDILRFDTAGSERMQINAAGAVGIGTTAPNASALVDISSTTKGFLPPRMTATQRDAVASPAAGLLVFNTTTNRLNAYDGGAWVEVGSGSSQASAVVPGWPELIQCSNGTNTSFLQLKSTSSTEIHYIKVSQPTSSIPIELHMNLNGTYNGHQNLAGWDCINKTLSDLISGGHAKYYGNDIGVTTADKDDDTKVMVEKNTDEDIIRFDTAGTERMTINAAGAVNVTGQLTAGTLVGDGSGLTNVGASAIADNSITLADLNFASTNGINIPQLASDPGSPTAGQMYYNTSTNKMMIYNGSAFVEVGSGASGSTSNPGFHVHKNGTNQTVTNGAWTLMTWSTEVFDTTDDFNLGTGRFTPSVAGRYIFTHQTNCVSSVSNCAAAIYKNGSLVHYTVSAPSDQNTPATTVVTEMNGTTDYVEAYAINNGGTLIAGLSSNSHFQGTLVSSSVGGNLLSFTDSDNDTKIQVQESSDEDILRFDTAGTERMQIGATGNVGIGTTPARLLHVNGPMRLTPAVLPGSPAAGDIAIDSGDSNKLKYYDGSSWAEAGGSGGGSGTGGAWSELFIIHDEKANATNGGDFNSGAWRTRDLNTVKVNQITGASLSSNQFTLPAGTYKIHASAPAFEVDDHKIKLRNTTDSTDTLLGTTEISKTVSDSQNRSFINGTFTISTSKTFEIQHRSSATKAGAGFGNADGFGTVEIYTQVMIARMTEGGSTTSLRDNDNDTKIKAENTTDEDKIRFDTAGSERMVIDNAGNVGIGITTPSKPLDVQGTANASNWELVGSNASDAGTIGFLNSNGPSIQAWGNGTANPNRMYLQTGGSTRVTIDNAGSVGVGTTSPEATLDVDGDVKIGNSSATCSATTEGSQRYNSTSKKMEFCNGTAWTEFGSASSVTLQTTTVNGNLVTPPDNDVGSISTATCTAGYTVTGGGCDATTDEIRVIESTISGNGWQCLGYQDGGSSAARYRAVAICARVQ